MIDRQASTSIKGLLIFLIVLGHNSFFSVYSRIGMAYLYTFHIQAFFMLPFLYPNKELTIERIKKYAVRFYYPYILFFLLLALINYWGSQMGIIPMNVSKFDGEIKNYWSEFLCTIINGNGDNIDYFTGFQFLWFLPVMFSMMILKDFFYGNRTSKFLKYSMVLIGLACFYIYFVFGYRTPFDKKYIYILREYSPFAITHAFGAFFLGIMGITILKLRKYRISNYIFILLFLIGTFTCFISQHDGEVPIDDEIRWILLSSMPFIFFFLVFRYRSLCTKSIVFFELGKYSFPIYMIHPFVIKTCFIIFYPLFGANWATIIISQIFTVVMAYFIARGIFMNKFFKAFLFPHDVNELRTIKCNL